MDWCVAPAKTLYTDTSLSAPASSVDFTASATDVQTGAVITSHGYRGGPFVIDAAYRDAAMPIVTAWLTAHPMTAVHAASADFPAPVARVLVNAPAIAVLATGNENIIFGYLNSAAILDGSGYSWSATSPGVLTPTDVAGSTTTNHNDGALFDARGPAGLQPTRRRAMGCLA